MRTLCLVLIVSLLAACRARCATGTTSPCVPGTRVSLEAPPGFRAVEGVGSLVAPDLSALIDITERKTPVDDLIADPPLLLTADGARVETVEDVTVDGWRGRLWTGTDSMTPEPYVRMYLSFGDDQRGVEMSAEFPARHRARLFDDIQRSFRRARWHRARAAAPLAAAYAVDLTGRLSLSCAGPLGGRYSWGASPPRSARDVDVTVALFAKPPFPLQVPLWKLFQDPSYRHGASIPTVPMSDRRSYSLALAEHHFPFERCEVSSVTPVRIDGLAGFEVVLRGPGAVFPRQDKVPRTFVHVTLFEPDDVHTISAWLPDPAGDWLEEVGRLAASFRRLPFDRTRLPLCARRGLPGGVR